ncbi:MAG: NUDIX hydrolase [Candidatus Kaiserbacteria bacterium]|nr:NUDIX hydrolase [Candidatus Kaiserbacteria bacterium]MCB9816226.1 NUDIX hydrolase [Candidatus Nomurabacteria bacterium]
MKKGFDFIGVAVTTMCHDGRGKYLLEHRSDKCRDEHFTWSPVGSGGIKFGETIEEAIHREVKEECNASVVAIEKLGIREVFREIDGKITHWIQHDFKVEIDPTEVQINEPEKCLELKWFALEDFPEPQHSQFPYFLKKYKDKL